MSRDDGFLVSGFGGHHTALSRQTARPRAENRLAPPHGQIIMGHLQTFLLPAPTPLNEIETSGRRTSARHGRRSAASKAGTEAR